MPDNQLYSPKFTTSTWSINDLNSTESDRVKVIRKFINPAIYVEKAVPDMPPLRKRSPIFENNSDGEYSSTNFDTSRTVKICSCSSLTSNSEPHTIFTSNKEIRSRKSAGYPSEHSSDSSDIDTLITVKSRPLSTINSSMRISLTSLPTDRSGQIDYKEKEEMVKNWLRKKDEERKKKELLTLKQKQEKEKQRQDLINRERENFKKWLSEKKLEEEKKRKLKEKEEEERKLKEAEEEKKQVQNEISFNLWLRRKKRLELERKIQEKFLTVQVYEDKQKRLEENERAFQEWLKNSKTKPKPIPLNQGLRSLCSSTSVNFINPVPWMPNIEVPKKPVSQ